MRGRLAVVSLAAVAVVALAACEDGGGATGTPSTLVPRGSGATVAVTTIAPASTTTFSPPTLPPPTAAPSVVPVGTIATATTTVATTSTTIADSCRTDPGPVLTIEIVEPMPLPYCVRVRTDQALRVVNLTPVDTAFNIYRGALEDLFQTPELTPGQEWSGEATGTLFPAGSWSLEIDQIADWVGTMIIVEP